MNIFKKIFLLSIVIFSLSLLILGVYYSSFSKKTSQKIEEKPVAPDTTQETPAAVSQEKIKTLTDKAVFSPILTPDEMSLKYYAKDTGKVFQIGLDGENEKGVSETELSGLSGVSWSPDGTKVITKFVKGVETNFFYYDYTQKKGVPLKKNLDEVVWQAGTNKIFYKYYDPKTKERTLNIADPDGSNWKKLSDLAYKFVSIASIPKTSLVSFWNRPNAFEATSFESVPVIGGEKKLIYKDKFGADYLWNNSGSHVLVSNAETKGGSKMQLATVNYNGGEYRNLDFPTFVSKCVWSNDDKFIYCALPGGIPENAVLPNEYLEGKFNTTDTFWKINVSNGEKTRIVELSEMNNLKIDASGLFLNTDESYLFLINRVDGKLYRVNL